MRLTNTWREATIRTIVEAKLKDKEQVIKDKYEEFALAYINKINKPFEKELGKIPDNYLNLSNYPRFQFGNAWHEEVTVKVEKSVTLPSDKTFKLEGKDKTKLISIYNEAKTVKAYKEELRKELFKVIYACTTDKMLLEALPDIGKYITMPQKNYPLTVQSDKLIKMLEK